MWQTTWQGWTGWWSRGSQVLTHNGGEGARDRAPPRRRLRAFVARLFGTEFLGLRLERPGRKRSSPRRMVLERCEAREVFDVDTYWQSGWQNPDVPADVVPDGVVAPADLLRIANDLAQHGEHPLERFDECGGGEQNWAVGAIEYLDVTGDRWVTRHDFDAVLDVLEQLSQDANGLDDDSTSLAHDVAEALRIATAGGSDGGSNDLTIETTTTGGGLDGGTLTIDAPMIGVADQVARDRKCINVPAPARSRRWSWTINRAFTMAIGDRHGTPWTT